MPPPWIQALAGMGRRPWASALLAAAILLAYPLIGLYPYDWDAPGVAANTAGPAPGGGLRFAGPGPGIARSNGPPAWIAAAVRSNRLEVMLGVRPVAAEQRGPARIMTLSENPTLRNLTIGQDRDDLIVRIRTPWHSLNGTPQYRVPGVFRAGAWVDLRVVVEPGSLRVEIDDELRLDERLPRAPLGDWDRSYRAALGNELTGERPWLGDIRRAIVRVGDAAVDYAEPGVLRRPRLLWYFHNPPELSPFRNLHLSDAVVNLIGFLPLGLLLGLWAGRPRGRLTRWGALALVFAMSLVLETLQFGIPQRYPSINDLFLNVLGGAVGIQLARWARRPPFAPRAPGPTT